jgi:hypothetical protein
MRALDLIRSLAELPPNAPVVVRTPDGFYGLIGSARQGNIVLMNNSNAQVVILEERPLCEVA